MATNNRNARGIIYVRGEVRDVGRELELVEMNEQDMRLIRELVNEFSAHFGFNAEKIMERKFTKIIPVSHRPYGQLYAY
ncbi:hypothetical protein CW712_01950 [Candidatus Bathyarchaeota archaeon]|nr:MAG: hypothetical protein CW712_01950 [Candidatus Bathyarchaeota archaeon]